MTPEITVFTSNEQSFDIAGPAGRLSVRTQAGSPEGVLARRRLLVVVAHPHPQHGGTMDNKVVVTLARAYRDLGIATVRFNFRGVGDSEGVFDFARGEVDDMQAVVAWAQADGQLDEVLLAGFSFGSAVAAAASYGVKPAHLLLVAPPVERYAYDQSQAFLQPTAVVIGADDEVVDVAGVRRWAEARPGLRLSVLEGTGHFFHGKLVELKQWVSDSVEQALSV
ncbi:alpha/beta hydrolase [Simiduia agarivorans]|uniref:Xaa-Pro dipeptidyl-peptidase-like domain-containing protein n=1 Tax=Simiduia agarivorans (strain DSM 21679 / JCM 13881 / BCRC 17597 / SA1) TaxID=1117647 RepID=K4L3A6_SIMAS|nr:alpha/beta fold hydrolase [Simiduia agarivorans]AFV00653.1 hypothetical protein M5M_17620 [Simiduia agarivorans SA1 = DSM 21679]